MLSLILLALMALPLSGAQPTEAKTKRQARQAQQPTTAPVVPPTTAPAPTQIGWPMALVLRGRNSWADFRHEESPLNSESDSDNETAE